MTKSLAETEMLIAEAIEVVEGRLAAADKRWAQVIEAVDNLDFYDGTFKTEEVENARRQVFRGVRGEIEGEPLFWSYVALRAALGALQDHNDGAFWHTYSSGDLAIADEETVAEAAAEDDVGQSAGCRRSKRKRRRRAEPRRFDINDGNGVAATGTSEASAAAVATSSAPGSTGEDGPENGETMRRALKDRLDQLNQVPPSVSQIDVVRGANTEVAVRPKGDEPAKAVRRATATVAASSRAGYIPAAHPSYGGEEASVVIVRRPRPDSSSPSSGGTGN